MEPSTHPMVLAYASWLRAIKGRAFSKSSGDGTKERKLWEATESALRLYSRMAADAERTGSGALAFPAEIALFVADAISEVLAGGEPESWRVLRRPGAPLAAARERDNITVAVSYVRACKSGVIIDDQNPIKTVEERYGVARTTVSGWCNDERYRHVDPLLVKPEHVAVALGIGGRPLLRSLMEHSGAVYRSALRTRSRDSINERASKRKSKPKGEVPAAKKVVKGPPATKAQPKKR